MRADRRCLLQIHLAVLFFGMAGLAGKLVAAPAVIIVLGRVFFGALFLLPLVLRRPGTTLRLAETRDYGRLALLGIVLALHWFTFFQSIQVSTVAVALVTYSTFPVFVTFLEPVFFHERLRRIDLLAALITFGGVVLVIPRLSLANALTRGALWGIVSGATFAVLAVLNRSTVRRYSSLVITFYQDAVATLVLLPFWFLVRPALRASDWLVLIALGVVCTGGAYALFVDGMTRIRAHTAAVIASLEPVYGIVAALVLLGEVPALREIAGGLVILGATTHATLLPNLTTPDGR